VREGDDFVIVDAFHGFGGDHGVDDGFFGGLDGGQENWVERIVGEHGELVQSRGADGAGIGGGEGEKDVAGAVAGVAAIAAEAEGNFLGDALELRGDEWCVGGDDNDDGAGVLVVAVGRMFGNFFADGNAGDAELVAASVVALDEDADGIAASFGVEHARGGADAAFEFVADHARSAADVAFFDGAGASDVEGVEGVFGVNVESVDVVEPAVPGFGDDGQRPPVAFHIGRAVFNLPGDDGVADDADAVRVGDHDGAVEEAGIVDPGGAGHFAVAVEGEPGGEDGVVAGLAAGMNGGDAGADRALADYELAAAGDEGGVADLDSFDICNGVVGAGGAVEGDAEIAGAGLGLGRGGDGQGEDRKEKEELRAGRI
jgi:hypothetical protein